MPPQHDPSFCDVSQVNEPPRGGWKLPDEESMGPVSMDGWGKSMKGKRQENLGFSDGFYQGGFYFYLLISSGFYMFLSWLIESGDLTWPWKIMIFQAEGIPSNHHFSC